MQHTEEKISQIYCDIFCRVIDNFGDVGVTLRLARQLACEYGATVRLIVDNAEIYKKIAAESTANLAMCAWQDAQFPPKLMAVGALNSSIYNHFCNPEMTENSAKLLVIEAFGCALPESYVEVLSRQYGADTPTANQLRWLNLEYLSAESWVESHHLLPSPHPRLPLTKTFFFPGFTPRTGGLLREKNLLVLRDAFLSADANQHQSPKHYFLAALGVPKALLSHALFVFLFCYENTALKALLHAWQISSQPVVCLLPAERTHTAVCTALGLDQSALPVGAPLQIGALTLVTTPLLPQPEFDKLLWACDVNFVRGEDSMVRAHWAAKPFCWQVYVQDDGAHLIKLEAFLNLFLTDAPLGVAQALRALFLAWNRQTSAAMVAAWDDFMAERANVVAHVRVQCERLSAHADCATNIVGLLALQQSAQQT